MNRPLPNDDYPETKRLELEFVERHALKPYNDDDPVDLCGILTSRALGGSYVWPKDKPPLTVDDLQCFSQVGHTLGFDYCSMYVRYLAFDLDCVCRVNPNTRSHLNEAMAEQLVKTTIDTLQPLLNLPMPKKDVSPSVRYMIWRRGCGFHVYFDLSLSLETHLLIGQIVAAKFSSDDVCVEVPVIMPLPYSAKRPNEPYLPLLPTQPTVELLPNFNEGYHTLFEYSSAYSKNLSCVKITTRVGDTYGNRACKPKKRFGQLNLKYIQSVAVLPDHKYLEPLVPFINRMALSTNENVSRDLDLTGGNEMDSVLIDNAELMERFTKFMVAFNKKFIDAESVGYDTFVNFAVMIHDGMYLQHYVVMLHKSLAPITDSQMTAVLKKVFANAMNPVVERFIKFYDSRTLNCYSDTTEAMMKHLHFLYINGVTPFMTLSEQIDSLLCAAMCVESSVSFQRSLQEMDNDARKRSINLLIQAYCEIIIAMRVVMYNASTSNYYILSDLGTHYRIGSKLDTFPTIFNWLGNAKSRREAVHGEMEILRPKYSVNQTELLSNCKFQISTSIGVFNSAIGLYTGKTRFLRFLCYRDSAISELGESTHMYPEQNLKLVERYPLVERYVNMMFDDIVPIFTHFVLAPAFIQLRRIHQIEEHQIHSLIKLLTRYQNLESAHFLMEYFPIDPKFVFVIMYIYTKYDNFCTLERYQAMIDHIFHVYDISQVDTAMWTDKFDPIIAEMKYTEKDTYLDTLLTIDHPDVNNVSEDFCLFAVLMAVCFIKCHSYSTMCEAFKVTELPPSKSEHPEYKEDFEWTTSLQASIVNMRRTIRIVFPGHHDSFEYNLILAIFAICMSTFFDPEITRDFVICISAIFLPSNVQKKCYIMYGPSGTGKSLFSNIIQFLASPKVGRYTSLNEAMDRANVTLKNNVIIINEVKVVDGDKIKAVTGNDAESTKQFYSQEYEMHNNQSLIFGATNSIINFKNNSYIDQVSVRRFHVVNLYGQQMPSDFKSASMFTMMANAQLYSGTMRPAECEVADLANGVGWLSFVSYMLYRDENLYPAINTDSLCNREYSDMVYRSNNKLYDFLVTNGIMVASGFHMRAERFVNAVKLAIRSAKTDPSATCTFSSFPEFKQRFESGGVMLPLTGTVQDYQEIGLVQHIQRNMSVNESSGSVIEYRDIIERTAVYSDNVDRENALSYFARENKNHYDHANGVYRDIAFVNLPLSYDHNVIDGSTRVVAAAVIDNDV